MESFAWFALGYSAAILSFVALGSAASRSLKFQRLVLGVVADTVPNAYGVPIWEEIERRLNQRVSVARVYRALESLEERGRLTSRAVEGGPERGGRAKRYYELTECGAAEIQMQAHCGEVIGL